MRILIVGKFPPIQGGVSSRIYAAACALARRGHEVHVVTNALETPFGIRERLDDSTLAGLTDGSWLGGLRVHWTQDLAPGSYLPWANPFASKLFGRALDVASQYRCDLVLGWYFEPYGLVAAQVAALLHKPLLLCHAGSDLGRLAEHPDLAGAYRWMLAQADWVLTNRSPKVLERLRRLQVQERKFRGLPLSQLPAEFSPRAKPLDLNALRESSASWFENYPLGRSLIQKVVKNNQKPFNHALPTVGTYGKVAEAKGTYDLIEALHRLAEQGIDFQFVPVASGSRKELQGFYETVLERPALAAKTFLMPCLPPWDIPGLIRSFDVVCFLERQFPITFHAPRVPREVLATGTCLVVSREIADKQAFARNLVSFKNCVVVEDPTRIEALTEDLGTLLQDRRLAKACGRLGHSVSQSLETFLPSTDPVADAVEEFAEQNKLPPRATYVSPWPLRSAAH